MRFLFNKPHQTTLIRLLTVLIIGILIVCLHVDKAFTPLETEHYFTQQSLGKTYHLFDFGVADVNDDNWLDIYTVNHSARQSILVNDGSGKFTDQLLALGLSQNSDFPGVGPAAIEPSAIAPGLYIYWYKSMLVVRAHNIKTLESVTGKILLPHSVTVKNQGGFGISTQNQNDRLSLEFTAQSNGQITIESTPSYQSTT